MADEIRHQRLDDVSVDANVIHGELAESRNNAWLLIAIEAIARLDRTRMPIEIDLLLSS